MGPKGEGKKKQAAVVVAEPIGVEADNEITADQLRYIAEPWFTTIPDDVIKTARRAGRAWRQRRREVSGRGACAAMPC